MTKEVTLTVNETPIKLDYFVESYVDHVVAGIVGSLHGTGEIQDLELVVEDGGNVKLHLNGENVSLKPFPKLIIRQTLEGLVKPLKGVDAPLQTLRATLRHT
jgi:hypothetical protein